MREIPADAAAVQQSFDGAVGPPRGSADIAQFAEDPVADPVEQLLALKADPSVIATNDTADTSGYTALQKKSAEYVKSAKSIAQFMDRDTRPDFASTVMIPAIQDFIKNPSDIDGLCSNIEAQKKSIFGS